MRMTGATAIVDFPIQIAVPLVLRFTVVQQEIAVLVEFVWVRHHHLQWQRLYQHLAQLLLRQLRLLQLCLQQHFY